MRAGRTLGGEVMARMLRASPGGGQCLGPPAPGATVVGGVMATAAIWRWELSVFKRLIPLTVAAFAVGTNSLVIAGLLPAIAQSLQVSVSAAGQLVTGFALTYAIAAPVAMD